MATALPTRHALVTGAAGGIGRGICMALIEQARRDGVGIHISAASTQGGARLDGLLGALRAAGAQASGVVGDLTVPEQCADIVAQAQQAAGDLHLLVCNAGASGPGRLVKSDGGALVLNAANSFGGDSVLGLGPGTGGTSAGTVRHAARRP